MPVVKHADQKSLREIANEMNALAAAARVGKLKPSDMQGATFTISSLGGIGGTNFTPIINAPEVAILGMVKAEMQPQWDGAAFQPRLVQPLSLSWDHRVVDGVGALPEFGGSIDERYPASLGLDASGSNSRFDQVGFDSSRIPLAYTACACHTCLRLSYAITLFLRPLVANPNRGPSRLF